MDLKQIQDDLKDGKIISKMTWMKLLDIADIQQDALTMILVLGDKDSKRIVCDCREKIKCI